MRKCAVSADLSYKNHKCADLVLNMCEKLVDKYISNICPQRANSFEHVDVLCGLGAALYNLI